MSYKDEQRNLKAPDELQKLGATAVPWLEVHGRNVILGVLAVVVVFAIGTGLKELSNRGEVRATHAFGESLKVLSRDVNASPTAVTAPGDEPAFKTEQEKDEALVKNLTEFRKANEGRKAAASAALPLAQALLRQGKAADTYTGVVTGHVQSPKMRDRARHQIFAVFWLAHVSRHKQRICALRTDQRSSFFACGFINVRHHYFRTFTRPDQRNSPANAGRRACDQSNFIFQHIDNPTVFWLVRCRALATISHSLQP